MRFTPTAKYLMYAKAAAKTIRWYVYLRLVTVLDAALDAAPAWTDVSDHLTEVPDFGSMIEHEFGQSATDSVDMVGKGLSWWETNFFSAATETDYIELKASFVLGSYPDVCTDTVITFSGFVDHVKRKKN